MKAFLKLLLKVIILFLIIIVGVYIGMQYGFKIHNSDINEVNNLTENEKIDSDNDSNVSQNGFIITYEDEEYIAKTKKGYIAVSNKRNLPNIKNKNNQEVADNIKNELVKISDKYWDSVKEQSDEYVLDHEDYINDDTDLGVSYIYNSGFKNDKIISFTLTTEGSMGGVGWSGYEIYNFDITTGELLSLKDIVEDYDKTIDFITFEMEKHVKAEGLYDGVKEYVGVMEKTTLRKRIEEYIDSGIWQFEDDSFIVTMPKYSIGNGAMGLITCSIDIKDMNEYLKTDYQI